MKGEEGKRFLTALLASGLTVGLMVPAAFESSSASATTSSAERGSTSAKRSSSACAGAAAAGAGSVFLTDFPGPVGAASNLYAGTEGDDATATISVRPGDCVVGGTNAKGDYVTEDVTATAGSDYTETSGSTPVMCSDIHPDPAYCDPSRPRTHEVDVPLSDDLDIEDAVESFVFKLTGGTRGVDQPYSSAPVHIIDADGPQRFSLEPSLGAGPRLYTRGEYSSAQGISVPVFRAGPVAAPASVTYELRGSGDHPADPEEDIEDPGNGSLSFAAGQRLGWLRVDIVNDDWKEEDETFDVTLTEDSAAAPASVTVMILDDDSGGMDPDLAPPGKLHHPKKSLRYPQNYPFLNEIHIFTKAVDPDLPVFKAQLALRKRLKSGKCAWWNGSGFTKGACYDRRWFGKGVKNPNDNYFLYKLRKKLPLSVGKKTNVRAYKIFGRWWDEGGRQSLLKSGRNKNRFEVIKRCKGNPYNRSKCRPKKP